jgi:hypothetical protein
MDVVFDEVRGNVVGQPPAESAESDAPAALRPPQVERALRRELSRARARRARLQAD